MKIYIFPSREYYLHFHLAGIRSRIDSSSCGNAIKILHPRKRRFCNYFCAPSPRAEMHMKIYISPSREYYPAPTIPLAEVQPKFCIPASGGLLLFQFLSPLEEMHRKLCIPASGNAKRMLHLRFAEMQADVHIKRSKKIVQTRLMVLASMLSGKSWAS